MKILKVFIFCCGFTALHCEPFSFKEINSIPDFELAQPQFLIASDDIQLAYYPFADATCKNILILYAGAGLYGNKIYQWVAKTLYEKYNIGCYIFDIRGHGHSQGVRGDASSIEQVLNDVSSAVRLVKEQHPESRIYLTGHSSGAGLIINYAAQVTNKLEEGYIFIAPYLGPKSDALKQHKDNNQSFVKSVRTWVYILGAIFPNSFFIHWNAVFFNYSLQLLTQDPLIVPEYTYVMSMATTPYEVKDLMTKIDKPTAIFIGNNDEQFIASKVLAYGELIKTPVQTQIVDGAKHVSILLETPKLIAQYLENK